MGRTGGSAGSENPTARAHPSPSPPPVSARQAISSRSWLSWRFTRSLRYRLQAIVEECRRLQDARFLRHQQRARFGEKRHPFRVLEQSLTTLDAIIERLVGPESHHLVEH